MLRKTLQLKAIGLLVCLVGAYSADAFAQGPEPPPPAVKPLPVAERTPPPRPRPSRPATPERPGGVSERAIAVDPNVNIQLPCVSQARVSVNGWQRDEIRVFIRNGSNVNFKIQEKDPRSGKPVWVLITRQATGTRGAPLSECISGERIDIEVPSNASLSITGRETDTRIDSVRSVNIKNLGGKVGLRNVMGGISAETYVGDVTVESSGGRINLSTTTGNIVAYGVNPGRVGDLFSAKTSSGTVTLQNVEHRQIDATSVSGSLLFNGKFLPGGIYKFKTTNGTVKLAIPQDSSCQFITWYGFGSFDSEMPIKVLQETVTEGGKSFHATLGKGEATVNLTTSSGTISILRQ